MPSLLQGLNSSSASSSPSNSPQNVKNEQCYSSSPRRKLTRQRKLKNVSDDQLGLMRHVQSTPVSPEYNYTRSENHWSRSAVPQPLPLPDVNLHSRNRNRTADMLSPSGGVSTNVDIELSYFVNSRNGNELTRAKAVDQTTTRRCRTPTYARRGFFQGLNVEGVEPVFELSVPPRSAPGSAFSSPINSPRSLSTRNHYLSPNHHPRHNIACADHSPLHSPNRHVGLDNYGNQHFQHKLMQENFMQRHEYSSGDLHQLPLPPDVSRLPTVHHCVDSLELSPMKGQWQRGKLIGRGTYGSVYVATHRETGALCAMKEVNVIPDDPTCAERIKQLEQEINVLQHLRHPNIVQYYGSEIIEDRFCIYLEYVHPGSINNYVREHCGAMTESIVRSFTRHILSGLAYLHSKKTIHRDIKGANLLVNASGVVKLADFGLAKHLTGSVMNLSLKGSPHWMAPEVLQAVLRKDTNPDQAWALDIWSLGCTVIEMFTGKPPWSEYTRVQAMFSVLNKIPPIPETLSGEGKHFLNLCLQREPMNRPSAANLLDHPFLQNRQDKHTAGCAEEFSEKLMLDRTRSPKDLSRRRNDLMLLSSHHQAVPTEFRMFGQISPRSCQENSESRASSNHSPRSTLEILPSIYSPELKGSSSPRNSWERAGDTSLASLRNHRKQVLRF